MDAALFADAARRVQGQAPLLLDLEAVQDDDHVVALFRRYGRWGAIARSNYSGLRFREPLFASIRDLVLSYVEGYFNLRREKTLRRYSRPVDVSRFDARRWMTADDDLWDIPNYLAGIPHLRLLTPGEEEALAPVSGVVFGAGLVGRAEAPLSPPPSRRSVSRSPTSRPPRRARRARSAGRSGPPGAR